MGGSYLGLAMSVWVLFFAAIVLQIVYRWTRYGTLVRAIGSNPRAAAFAGIPVKRIRLITYMLTGFLSGLAGVLSVAYFRVADPSLGSGTEIAVIAAAIIGGTALSGGSGTVLGALLGATLISVINSGLVYFGVSANWGTLVTGLVILGAVMLDSTLRQKLLSKLRIRR
jgi:ribose transport system permease protein